MLHNNRETMSLNAMTAKKSKLSKKEIDELRKKSEENAAAQAYEEFVAAFDEPSKHGKMFVRGTTYNAGTREEKSSKETGKMYKPTSKFPEISAPLVRQPTESAEEFRERNDKLGRKKEREKKKSNLELFKEELRQIQEEREERHRLKAQLKDSPKSTRNSELYDSPTIKVEPEYKPPNAGSYDTGDPTTTNLYLGNLNPNMTEQQLCEAFGKYGPLASVKVMWPRSEEEKARGRNCGFVAFMNRKDGERALKGINGKEVMGYEMKLGWGKAVPRPSHPVYIPPALVELTLPPPPSGLPFNAQPDRKDRDKIKIPEMGIIYPETDEEREVFERVPSVAFAHICNLIVTNVEMGCPVKYSVKEYKKIAGPLLILSSAVVKVVIPTQRHLLCLIHRMIEYVVREGPMFEAMIMNNELNNPFFRFLFENQSPAHIYYRWKLFSILQGDSPSKWRLQEFRMFKGGSWWRPPPLNPYSQGMPEELVDLPDEPQLKKGQLSNSQRDRLEDMLRHLTPERSRVADAMVFCIEHAEAANEIVDCVTESLSILQTPLPKKFARLYLVSDILHNCSVKIANASYYRKGFQSKLPDIFKDIRDAHQAIEGRLKAEQFKEANQPEPPVEKLLETPQVDDDLDGMPLTSDIDIDGVPLQEDRDDLDGVPMVVADVDPIQSKDNRKSSPKLKYAPSKWETVDPNIIEAQAMTTSKWDLLDQQEYGSNKADFEDLDGRPMEDDEEEPIFFIEPKPLDHSSDLKDRSDGDVHKMTEERRAKLRELELKVAKFQDELEAGKRGRKSDMTIAQQVAHYRQKLLRKEREKEDQSSDRKRDLRSLSPEITSRDKRSKLSGSPSPRGVRSRSRSRSPLVRPRSKSPRRHQRALSPRKVSHKSRSRSPKRSRRSRSPSPKHKSSTSRSPSRRFHKSKKYKR